MGYSLWKLGCSLTKLETYVCSKNNWPLILVQILIKHLATKKFNTNKFILIWDTYSSQALFIKVIKVILIPACPIEGQVRKECAGHPDCALTCNTTGPIVCPLSCAINGCECPDGTVLDEDNNKCVPPRQCLGTNIMFIM